MIEDDFETYPKKCNSYAYQLKTQKDYVTPDVALAMMLPSQKYGNVKYISCKTGILKMLITLGSCRVLSVTKQHLWSYVRCQ